VKRIPELDAIRGLAVLGVVMFHCNSDTFSWGWSSVDLFFVLSGYLITTIVLADKERRGFLRSFYIRRISRIWPVYYLTLAAVVAMNAIFQFGHPVNSIGWYLVFLQNTSQYVGVPPAPFIVSFTPSWSVAVEEQFYLVWPLVLMAFGRSGAWIGAVLLLCLCVVGRFLMPTSIELLFTRGDGLAFGCLLAWFLQEDSESKPSKRTVYWLGASAIVGGCYSALYINEFWGNPHPNWTSTCYTGFSLFFFALVGFCVRWSGVWWLRPLRVQPLRWVGTISYSLYLFHIPVFQYSPIILGHIGIASPAVSELLQWLLVFALPTLSWYALERPILRLTAQKRAPETMASPVTKLQAA